MVYWSMQICSLGKSETQLRNTARLTIINICRFTNISLKGYVIFLVPFSHLQAAQCGKRAAMNLFLLNYLGQLDWAIA